MRRSAAVSALAAGIVLAGLNLRIAVASVPPVLDEVSGLCLECAEIRGVGASRALPWDYDAAQAVGDAA